MSKRKPSKVSEITDPDDITKVLKIMKKLPEEGDMMKKMGDCPVLMARFYLKKEEIGHLRFYHGTLKLPDTSFSSPADPGEEKLFKFFKKRL